MKVKLGDYSDAYILFKGTIAVAKEVDAAPNNPNKKVIFKNCAPFTSRVSKINNTQVDDAQYIDLVMSIYNLIEYSDNYSKTSEMLWSYCRDEPAVNNDDEITDFNAGNADTNSFNIKDKITGQTGDNGTKNVEIMVPLKYLSNIWRTLKIILMNGEINLAINLYGKCAIVATNVADQAATFSTTDIKLE